MASQKLSHGVPVYTDCQLQNHAGNKQYVTFLPPPQSWHGSGDPPKSIQDQHAGNFQHDADTTGSIAGVAYVLEDKLKWVIAWSNAENVPNKVLSCLHIDLNSYIILIFIFKSHLNIILKFSFMIFVNCFKFSHVF